MKVNTLSLVSDVAPVAYCPFASRSDSCFFFLRMLLVLAFNLATVLEPKT